MHGKEGENISAGMTVLEIVTDRPETEVVFKSYDERVGECICCQRLFETVQQVAKRYRLDLAEFLAELNAAGRD